ncbi:allergin-1 [Sorex araneus]|uniref:allergin-1 n=1 Tax=Sorex araneus TaxID=42254 RepID=UPI00243378C1|nr:allergin-1 [Sorex araneus]
MFTISISTASELGSYKCKAQISSLNCTKYSNLLNFTFVGDATCPLCLKLLLPAVLLALLAVILTLAFWILRKHKARKAMKENALRVRGDKPEENVIYTTVKKKQAEAGSGPGSGPRPCVAAAEEETGHAQEIHYASPLFLDEASGGHDGDPRETDHVYCKLIL